MPDQSGRVLSLDQEQQEALRALLSLVHYDDLARQWLGVIPAEVWPDQEVRHG